MRLDGWKRIASHFGKERTTVMRWAKQRDMPIHRIPGAGRGGVYAFADELDAWLENTGEAERLLAGEDDGIPARIEAEPQPAGEAAAPAPLAPPMRVLAPKRRQPRRVLAIAGAGLIAAAGLGWMGLTLAQNEDAPELPDDPKISAMFLEAKADWAERSSQSIRTSIGKLQQVISAQPDFAPAYAALADSYVLAQEFGEMDSGEAFAKAETAYSTALRIDPENADALRARGFVEYWWKGDLDAARRDFDLALAKAPDSSQTLFWYGNVLTDAGQFAAGIELLKRAWLLSPNEPAIRLDLAWAKWSAGDRKSALREVEGLQRRYPDMVTLPDYLSVMKLADGDLDGFVASARRYGELRESKAQMAFAAELERTARIGPGAVAKAVARDAIAGIEDGSRRELIWPAFVASALGQDAVLIDLLDRAGARRERWYNAGMTGEMRRRYRSNPAILAKLEAVSAIY